MIEFETRMHAEVHRLLRITVSTAKQCSRTFPMGSSVALSRVSKIHFDLESGTHSIALNEGEGLLQLSVDVSQRRHICYLSRWCIQHPLADCRCTILSSFASPASFCLSILVATSSCWFLLFQCSTAHAP